jgi:hypothetical protein
MRTKRMSALCLAVLLLFLASGEARSQMSAGAISLRIDPSVRAAGMGLASNSVFWGGAPGYWANPAMLGYFQGARFEHGRTQIVPDFFNDVYFTTDRTTIGGWGIGLSLIGKPFDFLGEVKLDYGEIPITVEEGDGGRVISTHSPKETAESFSVGVNVLELTDNVIALLGGDRLGLDRFGDIGLGYTRKDYEADLAPPISDPAINLPEGAKGGVTAYDRGVLFRLTPYNSLDGEGYLQSLDSALDRFTGGFRFDVSYGSSLQNYNSPEIVFVKAREPSPVARIARDGWAIHSAVGMPSGLRRFLEDHGFGILADSFAPLLSWGKAWDRLNYTVEGWRGITSEYEHSGWELTVAGIYSVRRGRVDEPDQGIHGGTTGWSLGFSLANFGGFRYDRATVPQNTMLERVERNGYTVYVDPIELWRALN